MKKIVLAMVVLGLLASPAMAIIKNSKHDLSGVNTAANTNTYGDQDATGTEICVFCHTPHSANMSTTSYTPLWNRTFTAVTPSGVYNSATLSATAKAVGAAKISEMDALLCLSCHDGSSLTKALQNPSNVDGQPSMTAGELPTTLQLDADFSDDHPVGFAYETVAAIAGEELNTGITLPLFGVADDELWCSTCHDVHNGANRNFLVMDNAGSALCLTCHIK